MLYENKAILELNVIQMLPLPMVEQELKNAKVMTLEDVRSSARDVLNKALATHRLVSDKRITS